jgi:hypothetical protein
VQIATSSISRIVMAAAFAALVGCGYGGYERPRVPRFDPAPSEQAAEWREALVGQEVGGSAVGDGALPTQFYLTSLEVEERATDEDIRYLLTDPDATVRAMGLLAMARKDPDDAAGVLVSTVCDSAPIHYAPGGCGVTSMPVGAFVLRLLEDPGLLRAGWPAPAPPLIPDDALFTVAWSMLGLDRCAAARREAAEVVTRRLEASSVPFTWEGLSAALPTVDEVTRVKGLGRYLARSRGRSEREALTLLRSMIDRDDLEAAVRLASASVLVAMGDEHDLELLNARRAALDGLAGQGAGARLVADLERRLRIERAAIPIEQARTSMENEARAELAITLFNEVGAETFELLVREGTSYYGSRTEDVAESVIRALGRLLARARAGFHPWELDSDLAFRLRMFSVSTLARDVRDPDEVDDLERLLREAPHVILGGEHAQTLGL